MKGGMPTKPITLQDYGRRIARAMAHIAADLSRTPSLEELAAIAAFSPCHFHRVYRAIAGETPAETLQRARLSQAAAELLRTALPLAAIGRRAGYGSPAAFTRAFRAAYGMPPGAWRARAGRAFPNIPPHPREEHAMHQVTLREEPALRLAAIRHVGPYHSMTAAFDRLGAWAGGRGLIGPDTRFIAITHDDPESVPAAALRTDAGCTVPAHVEGEGEVRIIEVPAQRVAVLRFQGPYAAMEDAWAWLYRDWLPASGEEPGDHPPMEDYLNDCRSLPPAEWLTDIIVPLKRRAA